MRPHRYNTRNRYQLTDRQRHIMDLLAKRYTNQQIADDLGITLDGIQMRLDFPRPLGQRVQAGDDGLLFGQ